VGSIEAITAASSDDDNDNDLGVDAVVTIMDRGEVQRGPGRGPVVRRAKAP